MAISNFMNRLLLAAGGGHLEYVLRWDSWTSRPFELQLLSLVYPAAWPLCGELTDESTPLQRPCPVCPATPDRHILSAEEHLRETEPSPEQQLR